MARIIGSGLCIAVATFAFAAHASERAAAQDVTPVVATGTRLGADEIRALMLGKRMSGVREDTRQTWFECVGHDGDTFYNIDGAVSAGFVDVARDGRTCFTYPGPDHTSRACFRVEVAHGQPVFVETTSGTRFRVTGTDTDFAGCLAGVPVS